MRFEPKYIFSDYVGKTFNNLTVESISAEKYLKQTAWTFRCSCGNTVSYPPSLIISGRIKSCGCKKLEYAKGREKPDSMPARTKADDYIGKKNNKLTVVGLCRPGNKGRTKLECLCECGNITYVYPYQFNSGDVKSCGCLSFGHTGIFSKTVGRKTHSLSQHPFYKTWNDMIRRCHYPNEPAYKFYGSRGIEVCEEWRHAPDKFIKWCEETHPDEGKLTIDRIDGTKGYSPDNCRWIPQAEQPRNLRTNRRITLFGETKCITTWCNDLKIPSGSVYYRVKKGMSFEEAILDCVSKRSK